MFPLDDPKKVFDAGVAAYLLNLLKSSSYSHDDIAREYLDGMMLPSKEDLLGKTSLKRHGKRNWNAFGNYACYQAFVPCMARKVVLLKNWMKQACVRFVMRSSFLLSLP